MRAWYRWESVRPAPESSAASLRSSLRRSTALAPVGDRMLASSAKALGATLVLAGLFASGVPLDARAQTSGGRGGGPNGGAGGGFNQPGFGAGSALDGGGGGGPTLSGAGQPGGAGGVVGGGTGGAGGTNGFDPGTVLPYNPVSNYAGTSGGNGNPGFNIAGSGGGGGAGGYGAILTGTGAFGTTAAIAGGLGGNGGSGYGGGSSGYGGFGGDGGVGLNLRANSSFTAGTTATIAGGNGGAGGAGVGGGTGGAGGAGVYSSSGQLFTNSGAITGGNGGGGSGNGNGGTGGVGYFGAVAGSLANAGSITGGTGGFGAAGGDGGDGVRYVAAATVTNSGTILGGLAGNGATASGIGGIGVNLLGGGALTNTGTITGGDPVAPGVPKPGGAGVAILGGTLTNFGTITGGASRSGAGGVGVTGATLAIVNAGTIAGGTGLGGAAAGPISFTGGVNSLTLYSTSQILGNVAAFSTADTFALGGPTNSTFNVASISDANSPAPAQYQGFGVFQKTGTSTWTLTGTTPALTRWQVLGGTLAISQDANLGAPTGEVTLNGGTLQTTATFATGRSFTLGAVGGSILTDAGTTLTANGAFGGPGSLTKTGLGTLVLTGINSYAGGTNLAAGTLAISQDPNLGAPTGGVTLNGGTLQGTASLATARTFTLGATGGSILTDPGTMLTANGAFLGPGSLTKSGLGTLALTGVNSYAGGTNLKAGTLSIDNPSAIGSGALAMDNNTTLAFTGTGYTLPNNIRFTGTNDPTIDSGPGTVGVSGTISGAAPLQKLGTGTLILSGNNTYTGNTFIDGGTLQVDGSTASSPLTFIGPGAALTGSGLVGGIVAQRGSLLAPGSAANPFGTLSAAGPVTLAPGSTFAVSTSPITSSRLVTTGAATINAATLQVSPGLTPYTVPVRLPILVAAGGVSGQFSTVNFTSAAIGLQPRITYDPNDVYVEFGAAPGLVNNDVQNSIASAQQLARDRFGSFVTLRILASVLQGGNQQINCSDCITAFGSAGSFSAGVQGRKSITDSLSVIGGFAYAEYESRGVRVTSAPIFAGVVRYDAVELGSIRPFFDVGGIIAPDQRATFKRTYAFTGMEGTGSGSSSTTSSSIFGRVGYVARLGPRDELAAFAELSRGWQRAGAYTESTLNANPYPLISNGGADGISIAKLGGQWTHLFGTKIETQLNIGVAHGFDTKSGLNGSVNGVEVPTRVGDYTWAEYGVRIGYRLSSNWIIDGFANGTLGPKPIGDTVHGGLAARYTF